MDTRDDSCSMILIELGDLSCRWQCSNCKSFFKDTERFEKSLSCPACGKEIRSWVGLIDGENG